jgi:antitoxin MazE
LIDGLRYCNYNVITFGLISIKNMSTAIRTRIIKIGNSQGIRIPKTLLEQSGIQTEVEIVIEGDRLTIRPLLQLRTGWDQAFATMAAQQDEALLDEFNPTDWDQSEWEW